MENGKLYKNGITLITLLFATMCNKNGNLLKCPRLSKSYHRLTPFDWVEFLAKGWNLQHSNSTHLSQAHIDEMMITGTHKCRNKLCKLLTFAGRLEICTVRTNQVHAIWKPDKSDWICFRLGFH